MIGDRYTRERELGRGGMGAVWFGRDEVLDRPVAIKRVGMLPGAETPDELRAEREARIAASLNHPNVIAVYDLVSDDNGLWLVMEYFGGTTLADLVRSTGPLPAPRLAPILHQVALALSTAHAAGVVHRDVKPSNILLDENGTAKIGDFGIARGLTDEALTRTGLVTGSPSYLAPEVASGQLAGPPADVWSFGATAYHALSGSPPYEVGDNVLGALYRIVNEPPPRLSDPGPMGPLLEATMAHHPGSRWSMDDVARFLRGLDPQGQRTAAAARPASGPRPEPISTVVTPPVAPVAPDAPVAPVATARGSRRAEPPRRRRLPVLPVLVSLVVVALVIAIIVLALSDDPQSTTAGGPPSDTATSRATDPTTDTDARARARAMEQFVRDYVATASTDPGAGFARLTPDYQSRSGGMGGYRRFWGRVTDATVDDVTADPDALTVRYTYTYNYRGQGTRTETVSLQLQRDGDDFLIAGTA